MARILIVSGSGRANSNSRHLATVVAEAAGGKTHETELIDISKLRIEPCRGCEACLKTQKGCVIRDDMTPLYEKVAGADVLLFASPIYWFNMCGQTKQFIDRLFALAVLKQPDGSTPLAAKKIGAIFAYEDEDPVKSGCVNAIRSFQDMCFYTGAVWLGAVYGSAYAQGDVAGNVQLLAKAREYGASL